MAELTQAEADALVRLVDGSSGDAEIEEAFIRSFFAGLRIFKERQRKYGRSNIADGGASGVRFRAGDKLARLKQFYSDGKGGDVADESVSDTWLDTGNYGYIGHMVHVGTWPGAEDK